MGWFAVDDSPGSLNIAKWPLVLPSYTLETFGRPLGTARLMNFPPWQQFILSPSDTELLRRASIPGIELLPLPGHEGVGLHLLLVRNALEAVDVDNSEIRPPFCLTGRFGGHSNRELAFFDWACDEGFFFDPRFPTRGPFFGTAAAERFIASGITSLVPDIIWRPGMVLPQQPPIVPIPEADRRWQEQPDADARAKVLRKVEEGGRLVGVDDPLTVDPEAGARAIDAWVSARKQAKLPLKGSEREKVGAFFCDLVHRGSDWPWVMVRSVDVTDPAFKPAVVAPDRTLVVLSFMAFTSVRSLGQHEAEPFWTAWAYCTSPRRWERRRPFGYEML